MFGIFGTKNALKEHKAPVLLISYSKAKANEITSVLDTLMSPSSKGKEPYQVSKGVISNDDFKQALKDKSDKEVRDFTQKLIHGHDVSFAKKNIKIMKKKAKVLLEQKKATDDELKQIKSSLGESQKKLSTASKNLSKDITNHTVYSTLDNLNKHIKKFLTDLKFDYNEPSDLASSTKKMFNKVKSIITNIYHITKNRAKEISDYKSVIQHDFRHASEILPNLYTYTSDDTLNYFEDIKSDIKKLN